MDKNKNKKVLSKVFLFYLSNVFNEGNKAFVLYNQYK